MEGFVREFSTRGHPGYHGASDISTKETSVRLRSLPLLAATVLLIASANAQGPGRGGRGGATSGAQSEADGSSERFPGPPAVETTSKTEHEITINGRKIAYTATAGTLVLKKDDSKPWASMFYVA